ncbi:MAG TPA: amidohydrolase family protein, partial [Micrococcaceae bacterium]
IGHSPVELAAYQRARRNGKLHARAQLMPAIDVLHGLQGHPDDQTGLGLDLGISTGFGDGYVSLGPAKVFLDGSLFGETAALTEDYCGHAHGNKGYFQADPELMRQRILAAYSSGWSIAAHAIGDRAVDLAIDILTECQDTYGTPVMPNRIEHCSVTRPDQLPRLRSAGIAVTPQAGFFGPMGDQMTSSLGAARAAWSYRAASFLEAGILLAGSSDRPVADGNVLRCMQAFVDRRTSSGRVFGDPAERISARQALAAYTVNAARATGSFADKGSLAAGKLADFAVLAASPLAVPGAEISGIKVLATMVGGAFTHNEL